MEPLNNHLKNEDFFHVRKYPSAKFESVKVEPDGAGKVKITGKLTMLEVTKEIVVPAEFSVENDSIKLKSQFDFDRTQYGLTKLTEKVDKTVTLNISIGN
jgi:polyisoprenoid-binding protein YceI